MFDRNLDQQPGCWSRAGGRGPRRRRRYIEIQIALGYSVGHACTGVAFELGERGKGSEPPYRRAVNGARKSLAACRKIIHGICFFGRVLGR